MTEENDGQSEEREGSGQSDTERGGVGEISKADRQYQIDGTRQADDEARQKQKRAMRLRHKWNLTSLPNKLNIALTAIICVATVFNALILNKQVADQDRQVEQIRGAITTGISQAKEAARETLSQNKMALESILKENRDALTASLNAASEQSRRGMESSAAQSKASLDASIDGLRLDQRAWVGPSAHTTPSFSDNNRSTFLKVGAKTPFGVDVSNTGKTPARNMVGRIAVGVRSNREKFEPKLGPVSDAPSLATLFPGQHFRLSLSFPAGDGTVSQQMVDEITSGRSTLYVYGRIEYQDIFKGLHLTMFCLSMSREMDSFNSCSVYNDAN